MATTVTTPINPHNYKGKVEIKFNEGDFDTINDIPIVKRSTKVSKFALKKLKAFEQLFKQEHEKHISHGLKLDRAWETLLEAHLELPAARDAIKNKIKSVEDTIDEFKRWNKFVKHYNKKKKSTK